MQVFPLTDDYDYVQEQLQAARDAFDGDPAAPDSWTARGTAPGSSLIGDGLASCVKASRRPGGGPAGDGGSAERSRSVVLATDNFVSGEPIFTLQEAAALAKRRTCASTPSTPATSTTERTPDQPGAELRAAAEGTGGAYYPLDSPDAVADIIRKVQSTEATAFTAAPRAVVSDRAEIPLGIALVSGLVLAGAPGG